MRATAILESWDSGELQGGPSKPSGVLRYTILHAPDEFAARTLLEATFPAMYAGMVFQRYTLGPKGGGVYAAEVEYAKVKQDGPDSPTAGIDPNDPDGGAGQGDPDSQSGDKKPQQPGDGPRTARDWDFNFDTTGGRSKLFKFLANEKVIYNGDEFQRSRDFDRAINVKFAAGKDTIEGVEVGVRQFAFSLRGTFRPPLPAGWIRNVYVKTQHVNSDKVIVWAHGAKLTFEAGELLFAGCTGGLKQDGDCQFEMRFEASENAFLEGLVPNPVDGLMQPVTGLAKKGWDYLWIFFDDVVDGNVITPKAIQAMVGQTFETAALKPLLEPFNA